MKRDTPMNNLFYDTFQCELKKDFIEVGEDKYVFPTKYLAIADEIENFEVRDSDVWVCSYPKSGKLGEYRK